jgi:hypothetical protein
MVVECLHCLGTTQCQNAVHFCDPLGVEKSESFWSLDREVLEHWLRCQKCGDGYHQTERRTSNDPPFHVSALVRPICGVCEGRGFIIINPTA